MESISLSSNISDLQSTKSEINARILIQKLKAVSERSTNNENGIIFEKANPDAAGINQPQFQQPSATNQLQHLISDDTICSHALKLPNLMSQILIPIQIKHHMLVGASQKHHG